MFFNLRNAPGRAASDEHGDAPIVVKVLVKTAGLLIYLSHKCQILPCGIEGWGK